MREFKNGSEAAIASAEVAEHIIMETVRLLNKSMNLLDVDRVNESARYNIHHGFNDEIADCELILRYSDTINSSRLSILKDHFNLCDERRRSYCKRFSEPS